MSNTTNIQWCDSTTNPIMGCNGCELYPKPKQILAAIDHACSQAGITSQAGTTVWANGTAESLFGKVLDEAWSALKESDIGPGVGHQKDLTTTNIWHFREKLKRLAAERFSTKAGRLVQSTIEKNLKCYAAKLHANRGFNLLNPERKVNVGYAPNFEMITTYRNRMKTAAQWSDLTETVREKKPWLDGLPRMIFVSDMGDAFSRKQDFPFLQSEVPAFQTPKGQQHLWLWLTKRPKVMRQFADSIGGFPQNVCAMTTVTSAKELSRVDALRDVNAAVRGLSLEPLWEPLADKINLDGIDWVIVGGESGAKANVELFPVEWAIELRERCHDAGVAFFLKQLGCRPSREGREFKLRHSHGGDWSEWSPELRVREMPKYFYSYTDRVVQA